MSKTKKRRLNWCDRMPVEREELERLAHIVGKSSAAQQALDDADKHSGEVLFWRIGRTLIVEKLPEVTGYDLEFWK